MGTLSFMMLTSLDGFAADASGKFEWAEPDEEVHAFVNDLERPVGTHIYGRRMFQIMKTWNDPAGWADQPAYMRDYSEIWQRAEKVVISATIDPATVTEIPRARWVPVFDAAQVQGWKDSAAAGLSISGPTLAAAAFAAGLVDELHLFAAPVLVGGGLRALPAGEMQRFELVATRRFTAGTTYTHYRRS